MPTTASPHKNARIAGLGTIVRDHQLFVPRFPDPDTKTTAVGHRHQTGGPVPTALAQLAKLGHDVSFLGAWADDADGREIEADCVRHGIRFDPLACRTSEMTGFAHVWVEHGSGSRTIVAAPPLGRPSATDAKHLGRSAPWLHLDGWGEGAAIAAAEATVAAGGDVSLDGGSPKPTTPRLLELATVVNAPRHFVIDYFETDDLDHAANQFLERGARIVTITHGEFGAGIWTRDESFWLPAPDVDAADTCGAGDVFCAGLLDGVLQNLAPLEILKTAIAAAAHKVTRPGNRNALADRRQLDDVRNGSGRPRHPRPENS